MNALEFLCGEFEIIHYSYCRLNLRKNTVRIYGVRLWNSLDSAVRCTVALSDFKNNYKRNFASRAASVSIEHFTMIMLYWCYGAKCRVVEVRSKLSSCMSSPFSIIISSGRD